MPDVPDLAALTEAVIARLADVADEVHLVHDTVPDVAVSALPHIVRAVLEALPREWGIEPGAVQSPLWLGEGWTRSEAEEEAARKAKRDGTSRRVVWRAVGPPVPAEDQPRPPVDASWITTTEVRDR